MKGGTTGWTIGRNWSLRALASTGLALGLLCVAAPAQAQILGRGPEISAGREAASQVEQVMPVDRDPVAVARVRQIGRRLVSVSPERDLPFEFHVVETKEVNAFALPGGFIYVYKGLLQLLPSDDALAFVLAHEIIHATRRHGIRQMEKNIGLSLLLTAALGGNAGAAQELVQVLAGAKFSRDDEEDADRRGMALVAKAGYSLDAAPEAMLVVRRSMPKKDDTPTLLRSHPAPDDRIRMLRKLGGEWKERLAEAREAQSPTPISLVSPVEEPAVIAGLEQFESGPCSHYPFFVGATWRYRVTGPAGTSTTTVQVVEELTGRPGGVYRVRRDLGRGVRVDHLVAVGRETVLTSPTAGGDAWVAEAFFGGGDAPPLGARRVRGAGAEVIKTPAGEFTALRVEQLAADGHTLSIAWYAHGVGLVRRESRSSGLVEELESAHLQR